MSIHSKVVSNFCRKMCFCAETVLLCFSAGAGTSYQQDYSGRVAKKMKQIKCNPLRMQQIKYHETFTQK